MVRLAMASILCVLAANDTPAVAPLATPAPAASGAWLLPIALLALVLALAFVVVRWSRRRAVPADAGLRPAVERLRQALAGQGDLGDAFAALLAARLGCAPAAIVSTDLPLRLRACGVAAPVANRAAGLLEEMRSPRGSGGATVSKAALTQLVAELVGEPGPP